MYKVLLTVTNDEEISTTQGTMLVRIPPMDLQDVDEDAPRLSRGAETETSTVGLWGIGALSLLLGIAVFVLMMRVLKMMNYPARCWMRMGSQMLRECLRTSMNKVCFGEDIPMVKLIGGIALL